MVQKAPDTEPLQASQNRLNVPFSLDTSVMAEGDYHVEYRGGAWVIEEEGRSKSTRKQVESLATPDQAWRIALFYAQSAGVDAFLHEDRKNPREQRFRDKR